MLKVEKVSKRYGSLLAVDNLSFEVGEGEIFGLLGLNGAGKTTTFRMILNLFQPDEGAIYCDEEIIGYNHSDRIGFLSEERSLLTKMTVKNQIVYYAGLKSMTEEDALDALDYWLERFDIVDYKNKKIKELSKGNQQKIQFISAIIHNPQLLILDEPFTGLDPINVELFKEVILEYKEKGKSIIFSSHRMEHVEEFCEKLVILKNGKNILDGYLVDIKNSFEQKNIFIKGDINIESLQNVKGIKSVNKYNDEYEVKIENQEYAKVVFDFIKDTKNITLFDVRLPSLNEIFIEKVGESYE